LADKKKILKGHKKVGNRFIPPMMQLPNWAEISYVNQILPEIIWMGLINDQFDYRKGVELVVDLAQRAFELKETDKHINFTLASNFSLLSAERKAELVKGLEKDSKIKQYRDCLQPLITLYKDFPMSFIGESKNKLTKKSLVENIRNCVEKYIDKYETPALIIQANVVYVRSVTGGLQIAPHIETPDLNSLIDDPESEKARRAGSFARINAMQEFSILGEKRADDWSRSFWNQGYKIDKCDFSWEENDQDK
jgi:hypothetical protein